MGLGTYAGGWRIIKTLGTRIAKLDPPRGFAAQTTTAAILWTTAHYGFPVSTTHTISGSVLGAGATAAAQRRPLGRGREHPPRVGHDPPGRGPRGRGHGAHHAHAGGDAVVFGLAAVIAALGFFARRGRARPAESRSPRPSR